MKSIFKYLTVTVAATACLVSCFQEKSEIPVYEPASAENGAQVFFKNAPASTTVKLSKEKSSLDITVARLSKEALTVEITADGEDALKYFNIPGNVSFAADEDETLLTISAKDVNDMPINEYFPLTLSISDPALATSYGTSSFSFEVGIELPWIKFDEGTIFETPYWGEQEDIPIYYQQINDKIRYCVVADCFGHDTGAGYPVQDYTWYWNIETNQLYIPVQWMGYANSNGNTYFGDESSFYNLYWAMKNGAGYAAGPMGPGAGQVEGTDEWFAFCDAFRATYPEDYYPYYDGKGNFYLADQYIAGYPGDATTYLGRYLSDGHTGGYDMYVCSFAADYTIGLAYEGILIDKDGVEQILGELTFEGADVKDVAIIVVEGTDPEEGVAALEEEEPENTIIVSSAGSFRLPMIPDAEVGKYTLIAAPIDAEGAYAWDFAVYEIFQYGTPDPINDTYTEDSITDEPIVASDVTSRNWVFYANVADGSGAFGLDRTPVAEAKITVHTVDTLIVSGIYGLDVTGGMKMELYEGSLYTTSEYSGDYGVYQSYVLAPVSLSSTGGVYSAMYDNTLVGGFVDDLNGIIAFVDFGYYASQGVSFGGWGVGAFSDTGQYSGWWEKYLNPILVDADLYPSAEAANAVIAKSLKKEKANSTKLTSSSTKRLGLKRSGSHYSVIESGRVKKSANALTVKSSKLQTVELR